jgi:hypothetical protein
MEMKPLDYPGRNSFGRTMEARIEMDAQYSGKRFVLRRAAFFEFHLRKG